MQVAMDFAEKEIACKVSQGDYSGPWYNFCSPDGIYGEGVCCSKLNSISRYHEWDAFSQVGASTCTYDSLHPGRPMHGCHGFSCGIAGTLVKFRRKQFPWECCNNDYVCYSENINACFSDEQGERTCSDDSSTDGSTRSLISPACRKVYDIRCTGKVVDWLDNWDTTCFKAITRSSWSDGTDTRCNVGDTLDPEGLIWAQTLLDNAIKDYTAMGYHLEAKMGDPDYHPWADRLYSSICLPYPVICQKALKNYCKRSITEKDAKINNNTFFNKKWENWCGCWSQSNSLSEVIKRNVTTPCLESCNKDTTIPLTNINGEAIRCKSSVCVINDVELALKNSSVSGEIDVTQICGNCQGDCSCVVDLKLTLKDTMVNGSVFPELWRC